MLGSWPNTQKLTDKSWRFELFYWDYVLGIVLLSLIVAFTMGDHGNAGRSFENDIMQGNINSVFSAAIGGVIFNAGNIFFVVAITEAGMSVAFPIGAGLALVLGVIVNYVALPVGNPFYLFSGVALIIAAMIFSAISYKSLSKKINKISTKGILFAILAGILFGFFYRFIANAMATDFRHPEEGKLTPYTAIFLFAVGVLISNFLFNTLLMKRLVSGKPLRYIEYFKGSSKNHLIGIAGGIIWGIGLVLSIISAGQAGFAISFGLGQGNAMIAAIWGVFIWKEFHDAPVGTAKFLYWMFFSYILGLLMIVFSKVA